MNRPASQWPKRSESASAPKSAASTASANTPEPTKTALVKKQPGLHTCQLKGRTLELKSPSLTAAQFETLLTSFLEREFLYARETEYRLTCSVFAPIQDALDRCRLAPEDLDLILLVGGSSLIPQVARAVAQFFPKARSLSFPDRESLQVAIARGAAWHSLTLALFGRSLLQVATHDRIAIRTTSGAHELVPKGSPLPFPDDKGSWAKTYRLAAPKTSLRDPVNLLVEILASQAGQERILATATWEMPAPIAEGDNLCLEYRIDENQVLEFKLTLAADDDDNPFLGRIENPLSNVVNPHATRLKIQQAGGPAARARSNPTRSMTPSSKSPATTPSCSRPRKPSPISNASS